MNLKNEYYESKNIKNIKNIIILVNILMVFLMLTIVYLLWNYIASTWGLPVLTIKKFLATCFIMHIFISYLTSFRATRKNDNQIQMMNIKDLLDKGYPDEEKQ